MRSTAARVALLAALALVIPLRAGAGSGDAGLAVSAGLSGCGTASSGISCQISVSFNQLPDAAYYTATVTLADASVRDFGRVAGGGTSVWVPYVGSGAYYVEVTAWGRLDSGALEEIDTGGGTVKPDAGPATDPPSAAPQPPAGGGATEAEPPPEPEVEPDDEVASEPEPSDAEPPPKPTQKCLDTAEATVEAIGDSPPCADPESKSSPTAEADTPATPPTEASSRLGAKPATMAG